MTLREARFYKGFSQNILALKTGIAQPKISLIERGYVNPREDEKEKIAKALGCRPGDIFPQRSPGETHHGAEVHVRPTSGRGEEGRINSGWFE